MAMKLCVLLGSVIPALSLSSGIVLISSNALAVTLTSAQKNQIVSTQALSQDLFFLQGLRGSDTKFSVEQVGTINDSGYTLDVQGNLGDLDFTANYVGLFNPETDTASWTMTGNLGDEDWNTEGSAIFQNNNETIVWDSSGSINPEWGVSVEFSIKFGGGQEPTWSGSINGMIFDDINDNGSYDFEGSIGLDSENGVESKLKGSVEETSGGVKKKLETEVKTNKEGTELKVRAEAKDVPEPLTIFGSATALGFGALLKRESSKKKNKSLGQ